jgi:ribosomal protein S12 methylthiotransferase
VKIGVVSLGCPKNLVDSEVMLGLAEQAGHHITTDAESADVLVVNTCAFIDRAKQESIDTILEMAELKKQVPGRRLVVTGCLAERYREELKAEIPEIDIVLGTGEVTGLAAALAGEAPTTAAGSVPLTFYRRDPERGASARAGAPPAPELAAPSTASLAPVFGLDLPTYLYDADTPRRRATPGHYAYVKIAEGCDYKCAFCIIPKLRGHYRSRSIESVVRRGARAGGRRRQGVAPHLAGHHVLRSRPRGTRRTTAPAGGPERGRRASSGSGCSTCIRPPSPTRCIEAVASLDKVCKYIDLPLQHASDAVLKRMKRPGTRASYERLLGSIRARIPGVALRTTFITGFPGETEADVDALEQFIEAVGFDHVGVFTYSHEEGTSAYDLADDVPADVKEARQARLMATQRELVAARQRARIGERDAADGGRPVTRTRAGSGAAGWRARRPRSTRWST